MSNLSPTCQQDIRSAADIIRLCKQAVALTGAGISTSSGIPDFRSPGCGLWDTINPLDVASLSAFRYQPEDFFAWLRPLAMTIQNAQPNPAHLALARLEQAGFLNTVITQNIDQLHQRAGSQNIVEVHGSLATLSCIRCYRNFPSAGYMEPYLYLGEIPLCPECQGVLKPDIILFGEQMPVRPWQKAQEASKACDLMIVAGSSLEVLPVAGLPMRAIENGAHLIIINYTETYLDVRADVVFSENVTEVLPRIAAEVLGERY